MDRNIRVSLGNLWFVDQELQNKAFTHLLKATKKPADGAYEVWNELLANLPHLWRGS